MSEKKSQFIEVESLTDSQYVNVFGSSVDRKISKPNLFKQIKDESFSPFIYPTIELLQAADLEVDVDNPTYCRCEETEYRLYKITNAAAGVDDITLTNGNTATYQIEYRDTGFVTSVATAATGALAVFTDSTGQELDKSVVPTNTGKAFIQAADGASVAFPRKNADNTVTMRSASQYFDDIKQDATHGAAGVIKTADATSTLAQVATDEAITPANLATLKASNAETLAGTDDTKYVTSENLQSKFANDGILTIATVADISTTPMQAGQIFELVEYHSGTGYGGGTLLAKLGSPTIDNGSKFASGTAGVYAERINPKKTPYEFGFVDGGANASTAINACISAYGDCFLDGGKTYDIQYQIDSPKKFHAIGGVATLNCTSPTANTRFGSLNAAVYALGAVGNPLSGVDIQNINIDCNKLIGVSGSTGIKGYLFQRLKDFYQRNCTVTNCASYAFWDYDVAITGTTYCSGTRDDCHAIDAAVSFEQVNVRGITLNNCTAYTSTATLGYVPECQYHAYGGSDMRIVYNNCTGIADGACPAIVSLALEVKGLAANDCRFINNHNGGVDIRTALYLEGAGGNFGDLSFENCILTAVYSGAAVLTVGAAGSANAIFNFRGCKITGKDSAVTINGTGGVYEFDNCATSATASGGVTPWAYYNNGTPTRFKAVGGSAVVSGGVLPAYPSNFQTSNFIAVYASPSTSALPSIRQEVIGTGVLLNGGDNANYTAAFPAAIADWSKVVVSATIDSTGMSSANAAAAAEGFSANNITTTEIRLHTNVSRAGNTVKYKFTEYF